MSFQCKENKLHERVIYGEHLVGYGYMAFPPTLTEVRYSTVAL